MSVLKLKLLVTTGILLLVVFHWTPICLGDVGAGESATTLKQDQTDLHQLNSELSALTKGKVKKPIQKTKGGSEDDGYMEGSGPDDNEESTTTTTEKPDAVDEGYPEGWSEETSEKPSNSDASEEATSKPSESDDGFDTDQNQDKENDKVKEKEKGKEKGKDKDKDKGKGKEKKKTGLDAILPEDCGRVPRYDISGYIAGGFDAHKGEYPPYVRVDVFREGETERDFCGGTLISNRHVITAAHCLEHAKEVDVTPTIHAQNGEDKTYKSKKFCFSSGYNPESGITTHDIGLVTLKETVPFNDTIQPVCLPDKPLNKKKILRAVGLGAYDRAQVDPLLIGPVKFPDVLQVLPVKVEECNEEDKHETTVCFVPSDPKHKGDTCAGDSGGPIFGLVNKRLTIFGATSHGPPVCKKGIPGKSVNANIYNLRNELKKLYKKCGQVTNEEHDD